MKRFLGWVICWGLATICSATLLLGAEEATDIADDKTPCTYKFSKHEFVGVPRTSFILVVKPNRSDLIVQAECKIEDEQQSIGRFPLANINPDVADAAVKFRISCLANAYIEKSMIRVEIREKKTNKQVRVLEISLRDAVSEVVETSVKKR